MPKIHNLDESVQEYFDFIVKGHTYRFRHMNTVEAEEMKKIEAKGDEKKQTKYLYKFITPIEEKSPSFEEISKQMIAPQWIKFRKMVTEEYAG